jgi:adenylate kinase family enzyme
MAARRHIHIVGASASGTTTLGRALATHLGAQHLDTDDFYWMATDPPYTTPRPAPARLQLLTAAMVDATQGWVLSGSMMGWGEPMIPRFDLVVFLYVSPEIRIARLLARERDRYGGQIEPGGRMHAQHLKFIEWARGYDREDFTGRSLTRHRAWLATMPCPVVELDGTQPVAQSLEAVLAA